MSNAAATLVGQNLGAQQPERAETSVWKTGKYNAYFMGAVSLIYLFFSYDIVAWFNTNPVVIENGGLCLQIIAIGYIFYAYGMVVTQAFNGAGDTGTPTKINIIAFWLFQLPLAYLAAITFKMGAMGVFIAITAAEVLLAIISMVWFKKGNWKKVSV